ncbi:MAG: hypothetical protein JJU33_14125 [Phycisphaerales bacterium]|nr:hypothetical protein [Phycisphaerales bacterium]
MDIEKAFGKPAKAEEPDLAHEDEKLRVEKERHNRRVRRVWTWVIVLGGTWLVVGLVLSLAGT